MSRKIRIKLKSYDHNLVDSSAERIVKTVKSSGAAVSGPIPLPTHKRIFTVNRSTFVNKKSREQFQLASFKRLIDIYSSNPKTVEALLFEAESTKNGEGIDGTSGKVVDYKAGSISSSGGYFKLNSGDANTEKVYYIETPTYVEVSNGEKVPVGYRITGAQFAYALGTAQTVAYITYRQGNTTYYLNTNGRFENTTTPTKWTVDDDGCIYSGSTYLGFTVSGFVNRTYTFGTFSSKPDYPLYVNNTNNRIYGTYRGIMNTYTVYLHGSTGDASVATNTSNLASWSVQAVSGDNSYTLLIYDKENK